MTAAEWTTSDDVRRMVLSRADRFSDNRRRLFLLACCEAISPPNEMQSLPEAIRVVRRTMTKTSTVFERVKAKELAIDELQRWAKQDPNRHWAHLALMVNDFAFGGLLIQTIWQVVWLLRVASSEISLTEDEAAQSRLHADLAREVFGPGRKPRFLVRWRSETVRLLADAIHADQAYDRLPILADALEEAGCDNADLLTHCRGPGPHVLGCWALDLVRGCY